MSCVAEAKLKRNIPNDPELKKIDHKFDFDTLESMKDVLDENPITRSIFFMLSDNAYTTVKNRIESFCP